MRQDRQKTTALIAREVLKNPTAPNRVIAKNTGISERTVERRKSDVTEIVGKDSRILGILDCDINIVAIAQEKIENKLDDEEQVKNMSARDLAYISDVSAKRYSLLAGSVTDSKGGLNAQVLLSPEQTQDILKALQFDSQSVTDTGTPSSL